MENESGFIGPVNVGNPDEFTIRELAELIIELTKSSSEIVETDLPIDDPVRRQPDISLARERLQWEPEVELRLGLQKTIDWFKTIDLDHYHPPTPNF